MSKRVQAAERQPAGTTTTLPITSLPPEGYMNVIHVCVSKQRIMREIVNARSTDGILAGFEGTWIDALKTLQDDPREYLTLDPECHSQGKDGRCRGHRKPAEQ